MHFVRFWVDSNQTPAFSQNCPGGAFSGCQFVDLTEFEIFGSTDSVGHGPRTAGRPASVRVGQQAGERDLAGAEQR